MTEERIKERIKALQALAEQGDGGEKINAQKLLDKILEKYNVTLDEVDEEEIKYYDFHYTNKFEKKLLVQVMAKVFYDEDNWNLYKTRYARQRSGVYCTAAQALEIELEYEFHLRMFEQDMEVFFMSYIMKNELFGKPKEHLDLSDEEKELRMSASLMSDYLDKHTRNLMIEGDVSNDENNL